MINKTNNVRRGILNSDIIIRVPSQFRYKVKTLAKRKGMTVSSYIRSLLINALMKDGLI